MGLFKLAMAVEAARRLAAMAVDKGGLRSLEKIAFGMSDRGGISAADDIEEHILQHVVEIGGRHASPEIFPEQGTVRPAGFEQVGVGLTCGHGRLARRPFRGCGEVFDRKSTRLNSSP